MILIAFQNFYDVQRAFRIILTSFSAEMIEPLINEKQQLGANITRHARFCVFNTTDNVNTLASQVQTTDALHSEIHRGLHIASNLC